MLELKRAYGFGFVYIQQRVVLSEVLLEGGLENVPMDLVSYIGLGWPRF